ncbi:MAG: lipid-A-disaccharide synthase [Alistipes sp.]|nr:lipid-A-disaccharide synthase [Alistipes sp.]
MRYYLIAGEASGDLHGANLMRGLQQADPSAEFRFWGGDRMAEVGGVENLAMHYTQASFMGFTEVLLHLRTIFRQIDACRRDVAAYRPHGLILIDYAGFNLRIARFAHEAGIPTYYYIAPKVWAWKESRVKLLRRYVDRLFVIFPFEPDYFRRHGIEAIYEGNPLMDAIAARRATLPTREAFLRDEGLDERPMVALLAGSRRSEIGYNLPFMVALSKQFPDYQFVVAGVAWLDRAVYAPFLSGSSVRYVCNKTYELLSLSQAAVVTSGTATLETALLGVPEMVCYRRDLPSMLIGKMFLKSRYISLVNLVLDRECVRELLQFQMNMKNATAELQAILPGGAKYERMQQEYAELRRRIGGEGSSARTAARMVKLLKVDRK